MARLTKKRLAETWLKTEACFRQTLLEKYHFLFSEAEAYSISMSEMKARIILSGHEFRSEEINNRYLELIKQLDSETLSTVIDAHKKKKQTRSPLTIEVIAGELFERAATKLNN